MNILIIDDDADLAAVTADCLEDAGFTVRSAVTAAEALKKLDDVHLILLDISLPDGTGFDLCRQLRQETQIPIIFISARTRDTDKVEGLGIGGDDYVAKPYSLDELLARVKAHLRRSYPARKNFGNIEVDISGRKVRRQGVEIFLSQKEFDLLSVFINNKNTVIPKEKLWSDVWGGSESEPSTLTVHICRLREKLEENPANPKHIKTVHRVGYIFEVPV
ncbi:MAG: response regulator transcription factor [Peptococcaceae bacterium]|nr:response regulator transcription factor [Peptococcaceae bacterium]